MNAKKIAFVAAMVAAALVGNANAADQGHGKITFTGSIIDAPCSISPESIDQTVSLGQISNAALADSGTSIPRNFEIKLENCTDVTAKTVTTTFTGTKGATSGSLGITGTAKGASIILANGDGKQIELGKASDAHMLQDGNNTLLFSAYLQGDAGADAVPGDFSAIADFTLAYQ
ncbi:type 1 fimbrial protein [Enterobacter asburiae]|jgi:type 1 fimbria pilin|uniref:fimbrial protein n=1 Tax=Enterobacter asburiae TaxID=61645 RepID=UPI00192AD92D|nr:fimbrial protein [Enterobacter asburiae]MBL5913040.1 type 1 fimbrial protein [Enterobacter asburiae]MBL5917549.1 type 1 fimbrial protein [Enterobacter asburiae]